MDLGDRKSNVENAAGERVGGEPYRRQMGAWGLLVTQQTIGGVVKVVGE